jgi:general secretion pathway protein D
LSHQRLNHSSHLNTLKHILILTYIVVFLMPLSPLEQLGLAVVQAQEPPAFMEEDTTGEDSVSSEEPAPSNDEEIPATEESPTIDDDGLSPEEPAPSVEEGLPSSEEMLSVQIEEPSQDRRITMDFNNVDLAIFIRFVSEITGINIILDERVRGNVTVFSPTKIPIDDVYDVFLSVMDLKGFAVVPVGDAIQIRPASEVTPEREIFIYFLENANADEIAKLLAGIVSQTAKPKQAPSRKRQPAAITEFESKIQITPDKDLNALIIRASADDYEKLKEVIRQLDAKRRQVYVEAVIMEVTEDQLREFGSELGAIFGYLGPDDVIAVGGTLNTIPSQLGALTDVPGVELSDNVNIGAVLTALLSLTDVNVLSTPQILTTHNQKARIVVGQNVPFVTGSSQTTGGLVTRTVQRQDVGVTLELTPQVMEGDRVRLDIRQEISSVTATAESILVEIGPTTKKREAMTSVIIENHQTVVIGGLISDEFSKAERKIPLLGSIPLVGWLFKFQSKGTTKTNLLIFLTPHILKESEDLDKLREQKSEEMKKILTDQKVQGRKSKEDFLDTINRPASVPKR